MNPMPCDECRSFKPGCAGVDVMESPAGWGEDVAPRAAADSDLAGRDGAIGAWDSYMRTEATTRASPVMILTRTASAAILLGCLSTPTLSEPCWNCAGRDVVRGHVAPDVTLRHHHDAVRAPARKPRICYRPDAGRYSRLIPYEC